MARKIDFLDGALSGTAPTLGNIEASDLVNFADDAAYEAGNAGAPVAGNIYHNDTDNVIRWYDGTQWNTIATLPVAADDVTYDNATSGLVATDVQAAIDEVEGRVDTAESNISTNAANISSNDTDIATNASNISTNTANITSNDADIAANTSDIADIRTAQGTADGETDLGTFTGSIISDNVSVKAALQELESALEPITDGLDFQGTWNADTNVPVLVTGVGTKGHFYIVDTAGSTNLNGITDWNVGDWAVFDGTVWRQVDNSDAVNSVNGQTGVVVLDTDDISEGANLYNQTHTGDVSGATALTLESVAITGQTTAVAEAGDFLLFSDTSDSGNLKKIDFADVGGGGSGVGGINYITNFDFEQNVDDWATYDDTTAEPVDGTGGSPVDVTLSQNTGTPLRGTGSLRISKAAADAQGEGTSTTFTIDEQDTNKKLLITFDHTSSAGYVTGDLAIYIYDVTNAQLLGRVVNEAAIGQNGEIQSGSNESFCGSFSATDSTSYRLLFHVTSTNANLWTVDVDNVRLGPGSFVLQNADSDWLDAGATTITGTTSNPTKGTVSKDRISYRRDGTDMIIQIEYEQTVTGGAAGSGVYLVEIPGGFQADTNVISVDGDLNDPRAGNVGTVNIVNNAGSTGVGTISLHDPSNMKFYVELGGSSSYWRSSFLAMNTVETFTAQARIPIAEWQSSIKVGADAIVDVMSKWKNDGAITVTGTTSDPTKGTVVIDKMLWKRDGTDMVGRFEYEQSTAGAAGSGKYLIEIPDGHVVDTDIVEPESNVDSAGHGVVGSAGITIVSTNGTGYVSLHDSTHIAVHLENGSGVSFWDSAFFGFNNTSMRISGEFRVPIVGWSGATSLVVDERAVTTIKDVKANTTNGQSITSGSFVTRDLNTLNDNIGVSLSSNQFTIPPGKYYIEFRAPQVGGNAGVAKLRNITDSTDDIIGDNALQTTAGIQAYSEGSDVLTLTGTKTFEIQHRVGSTVNGGNAASFGVDEVYTTVVIERVK